MPKLNIMHFISALACGGAENMLVSMVKEYNTKNNVNLVVVIMNDLVDGSLKEELKKYCKDVIFINRKPGSKSLKHLIDIYKILRNKKIDIIHSHDFGSRIRAILFKILNFRLKVIYTAHTLDLFSDMNLLNKILHNKFVNRSVAISNTVYNEAVDKGIKNVVLINNGVDLKRFSFKKSNNLNELKLNIINVARVNHEIKGQDILIKALGILNEKGIDFKCYFVGDNKGDFEKSYRFLMDMVKETNIENKVIFTGSRSDVQHLLYESDLFVLPSRVEGFGLAIIEAMATGIPVVCSDINGPAELVKHGETGLLFKCEDYMDLSKKIIEIVNDTDKYESVKNNAYKFAENFDISTMVKNYQNLYQEIV